MKRTNIKVRCSDHMLRHVITSIGDLLSVSGFQCIMANLMLISLMSVLVGCSNEWELNNLA